MEISCIYKRDGKTRKVHHLICMPDLAAATAQRAARRIGNLKSDGRPILGLDSRDLLEIVLESPERAFFIPAHIWTPWFSAARVQDRGFDAIEACFGDLTAHIFALETGLSSDPPMNWRLSALDRYRLVSNSDAHSPGKARPGGQPLRNPRRLRPDDNRHWGPARGLPAPWSSFPKRASTIWTDTASARSGCIPDETRRLGNRCPVCNRPLTVGVLHRVDELADRARPESLQPHTSLIPLAEVLAELLDCGPATQKVRAGHETLLAALGPEIRILMEHPLEEIAAVGGPLMAEAIRRMRSNQVICEAGYDGEFGVIRLFQPAERAALAGQLALFDRPRPKPARRLSPPLPPQSESPARGTPIPATRLPADPILDPLNPEQKAAVLHDSGHLLVVAGPGTGKTRTLTHRIAYLIREDLAVPEAVLALTFTRKAAGEMRTRVAGLLAGRLAGRVLTTTFHGFCLELVRSEALRLGLPPGFSLCQERDAAQLTREVLRQAGADRRQSSRFLKALPLLRAEPVLGRDAPAGDPEARQLLASYQSRLRGLGLLDLDDLEVESLRLFQTHPGVAAAWAARFPWVFVDEYQDTSPLQAALLKALIRAGEARLFAIGDPNQAIYGFRGADVGNFLRFRQDFPGAGEVRLTTNYRNPRAVLETGAALLGEAEPLQSASGPGRPLGLGRCATDAQEAEMVVEQVERLIGGSSLFALDSGRVQSHEGEEAVGFADIAVLYRLNAQGDALAAALSRAGLPFIRSGESPLIHRFPANLLWRFLQTRQHPENSFHRERYRELLKKNDLDFPGKGASPPPAAGTPEVIEWAIRQHPGLASRASGEHEEALDRLRRVAGEFEGGLSRFLEFLSLERGIDHALLGGDRIALMTLHAAKGLEWPVVFITGCEDRLLPCTLFETGNPDEERRLLYVGMTRARQRLILSYSRKRSLNGRLLQMKPSPFLEDIPPRLIEPLERGPWKAGKKAHRQLSLFQTSSE